MKTHFRPVYYNKLNYNLVLIISRRFVIIFFCFLKIDLQGKILRKRKKPTSSVVSGSVASELDGVSVASELDGVESEDSEPEFEIILIEPEPASGVASVSEV